MTLDVPFFSQLDGQVPEDLRRKVCAIACIKMILDYRGIENEFANLLAEAQWIGDRDNAGWNHETLVRVLRNHGTLAYRQEFLARSIDLETKTETTSSFANEFVHRGIEKIKKSVDTNAPVMVSVKEGFSDNKGDHVVLVIGYENESLLILDPIMNNEKREISIKEFLKFWKGLSIFTE